MIYLKAILTILPELISLIKLVASWLDSGVETIIIKKKFKELQIATEIKDPIARASAFNAVFKRKL